MNDPYKTTPPQTLPGMPHNRMTYIGYFGRADPREWVMCQDCARFVPFEQAAEHQAVHDGSIR